ncbi:alpha/beta hydrolase [Shewanella algae]|uniref:alpha/beta hydrolase n=1 Tax=Shewanella algae TaxID=38313 RepID=UPI0031F5BC95
MKLRLPLLALLPALLLSSVALAKPEPLLYGYSDTLASKVYQSERRWMLSLPERYHATQDSGRRYPVLYIIDADFQFRHVSAAVNNLARMGKIPPMIVVGIAMQGQKDYLYSTTWPSAEGADFGGSDKMLAHLQQELVPYIDKHYRTSGHNALAGYSLGGLLSLQMMLQSKSPFSAFLAMSPSIWYDNMALLERTAPWLKQPRQTSAYPRLFLSLANEQGMGVDEFRKLLHEQAPEWHFDYRFFPSETHYSTAMPALLAGLESLTPGYFTDVGPLLQLGDYEAVLAHFEAKKTLWSGFHFDWLQAYTLGKYLYYSEQKSKMAEVLALAKKQFPEDLAELSAGFAKVLNNRGEFKLAKELLLMTSKVGTTQADWQQQLSLALAAEGDSLGAKAAHTKALELAEAYQLESWEWWELQ